MSQIPPERMALITHITEQICAVFNVEGVSVQEGVSIMFSVTHTGIESMKLPQPQRDMIADMLDHFSHFVRTGEVGVEKRIIIAQPGLF